MIRIQKKNINNPSEYNRIFFERQKQSADIADIRRWKKMLKYYSQGRLLDAGCLDSLIPIMAKKRNIHSEIWGIDIADQAIQYMAEKYPYINYHVMDIYHTDFPENFFDYITAGEVLEHLEYPKQAIQEFHRILKSGGVLAVSFPLEEVKEIGAVDRDRHLWSFSLEDVYDFGSQFRKMKTAVLKSIKFPKYRYIWDQIIAYFWK